MAKQAGTISLRSTTSPDLQSRRFLALYALAAAGGSAAYGPFLTLFLPSQIAARWGGNAVEILSYLTFAGAIAASLANVAFGWASDRTRNRTPWILAGLAASSILLVEMPNFGTANGLLWGIVAWQIALNMMLGPLAALAGDCIPDAQKGTLGGLLSIAPAAGALVGAIVTVPGLATVQNPLILIACLVAALVLPVLVFGDPRPMPELTAPKPSGAGGRAQQNLPGITEGHVMSVWRMWLARLLMQIAEAALFGFLLLWLRSVEDRSSVNTVATIFTAILFASVPLALLVGRWSDRRNRPVLPLVSTAAGGALGLLALGTASSSSVGLAGYAVFGVATSVFLALHSSQTLRVLPRPANRGRDLGVFNLTNTVPSLIIPWLAVFLIPTVGFSGFFLLLAGFAGASAVLLATGRRQAAKQHPPRPAA